MKILLTGADGQIGRALQRIDTSHQLIALDRTQLDITDPIACTQILNTYHPDWIINTAAYTAVDAAEKEVEKAYAVNCDGVSTLARSAQPLHIPILHLSTDYVFSGTAAIPYREEDPICPEGVYAKSKAEGESRLRALHPEHLILRVSWVFDSMSQNFIKTIAQLTQTREILNVVEDQMGSPTYAPDIASILFTLIEKTSKAPDVWGTYHYTGQPAMTRHQIAHEILKVCQAMGTTRTRALYPVKSSQFPTLAPRPAYSVLDTRKITRVFGIVPSDWRNYLRDVIKIALREQRVPV